MFVYARFLFKYHIFPILQGLKRPRAFIVESNVVSSRPRNSGKHRTTVVPQISRVSQSLIKLQRFRVLRNMWCERRVAGSVCPLSVIICAPQLLAKGHEQRSAVTCFYPCAASYYDTWYCTSCIDRAQESPNVSEKSCYPVLAFCGFLCFVVKWTLSPYPPPSAAVHGPSLPRQVHGVRPQGWGAAFTEVLLQLPVPLLPPSFRPAEGVSIRGTWNEEVQYCSTHGVR